MVVPEKLDLEEFARSTEFAEVVTTAKAIASHDDRIIDELRVISTGGTYSGGKRIKTILTETLAKEIDAALFKESLRIKIWDKLAKISWRPFEEAREFVHGLELKNLKDWQVYASSNQRPVDIPTHPKESYENQGWSGFGDWLGTGRIGNRNREFREFKKARNFARSQGIKNLDGWVKFCSSGNRPIDIPSNPLQVYEEYTTLGDWLGTGRIATQDLKYRKFEEAREFVRKLKFKTLSQYQKLHRNNQIPADIPLNPKITYKDTGWAGTKDWIGVSYTLNRGLSYLPYDQAESYVRKRKIKSSKEFMELRRNGKIPKEIPSSPDKVYKQKGWASWYEFLGTKPIRRLNKIYYKVSKTNQKLKYVSFEEARNYAHTLDCRGRRDWANLSKNGILPDDVPSQVGDYYKNKGWKGWGDFLGTWNFARKRLNKTNIRVSKTNQKHKYVSFEEARNYAHTLDCSNRQDWVNISKNGLLAVDVPSKPSNYYKNKGWEGWGDFLGTGNIAPNDRTFCTFQQAKKFVHKLKLKSHKEWMEYCRSGKKPKNIPAGAQKSYANYGWKNWPDFLGSKALPKNLIFREFEQAKKFVHKLKLKSHAEWLEYCRSGKRPPDIPSNPDKNYKNKGWKNVKDWLGV